MKIQPTVTQINSVFQKHNSWNPQYERMMRWYEKLLDLDFANTPEEEVEDLIIVCFQNIYYMKDWVMDAVEKTPHKKEVKNIFNEAFKSGNDVYLSFIRDLCNASKHKKLYSNRNQEVWIDSSDDLYVIRTKKVELPVLVVARYGVEWWRTLTGI